jgi:hypothetical protein
MNVNDKNGQINMRFGNMDFGFLIPKIGIG